MTTDLPDGVEPLVLADGRRINPVTGREVQSVAKVIALPTARDAIAAVTRARRKLSDLPAPPRASNALSVVLTYTNIGLSDEDIAIACDLTVEQVQRMRKTPAYAALSEAVTKALLETDSDDVRTYLAQHARLAAQSIVTAVQSQDEAIALRASMDVLDRAGHRPADVVEHRHRMEGGLTIEIIERSSANDVPSVPVDKEI